MGNDEIFCPCFFCSSMDMDDDALNMHNWGYYEPSFKGHLNLQLMTSMTAERDTKPFLSGRADPSIIANVNRVYHPQESLVSDVPIPYNGGYPRDSWVCQRDNLCGMMSFNPTNYVVPETSALHSMHMPQIPEPLRDDRKMNEPYEHQDVKEGSSHKKKRTNVGKALKIPKPKKARKSKDMNANPSSVQCTKQPKKSMDFVINGIDMDITGIPIPVCSCTGTLQQCYRWGCGGWQSACCTTQISTYPLPMSTKRKGARIAGRKMSQGAFKKVLEKLVAEGYNFANPIDLRAHWAKHGTNKFVTIRPFAEEPPSDNEVTCGFLL
ncbi:hypothetical protein SAY86_016974 [Trapa natans]|uniref:GAGA-binding transcriptional activator n=1 Tax=Trapa natans TaxID=22666 RepID=A0AAN7M5E9_TRANT|nr:hypothetical protein SAY86_016974 [Trapa natans]